MSAPSDVNGKEFILWIVANSLFNDTFTEAFEAVNGTSSDNTLVLTDKGIAWSTDKNRFKKLNTIILKLCHHQIGKSFQMDIMKQTFQIYPPGTNSKIGCALLLLATFNKLALRNDTGSLERGIYQIDVGLHFPVLPYKGNIYTSPKDRYRRKERLLGISWMVGGGVCFILGLALLVINR